MVTSFGEILMDCFLDKKVIGGAPLNVVTHLQRLGVKSNIITKIGKDVLGDEILTFLEQENLSDRVQIDQNKSTGKVDVTLKNNQPSYKIVENSAWEYIDHCDLTNPPRYFVFGSLALNKEHNQNTFLQFKKSLPNTTFICDINLRSPLFSKKSIELCLNNADILKINDEELEYLEKTYNISNGIKWLKNEKGISKILLTKGKDGADLFWNDEQYQVEVFPVQNLVDTVGAGDSFTAIFIYGLIQNWEKQKTLNCAAKFASKICETKGAIPYNLNIYKEID